MAVFPSGNNCENTPATATGDRYDTLNAVKFQLNKYWSQDKTASHRMQRRDATAPFES
jgi:hypothetical protein